MAVGLVTVFGGSGFVGRHLVGRLARQGWRIRVAVRHINDAVFLKPLGDLGQIQIVPCDITQDKFVQASVAGADAVINLVGVLAPSGHNGCEAVQQEGAARVARAAAAAGVRRLVHVSAIGCDEASPVAYARTKALGEQAVRQSFPSATILRPSVIFGPEDQFFNKFGSLAALPWFLMPVMPLIGNARFQPVYVGDVADAILAALTRDEIAGKTYELCGPKIYTLRDVLTLTLAATQRRRPIVPIPLALAKIQGAILGLLPNPVLTADQVELLKKDNIANPDMPGLAELDITPTTVEAMVPSYLYRYRKGGQFASVLASRI